ncbi:trypsin [Dictyocaulus viviparus]|uniref:Trypsin n=1 Tax=Dictyocaulus viviparus TaxID=29172 RepID=A0A0D8XDH5_DICVI|nr:trypsin [Dictyocaulus viviparus]
MRVTKNFRNLICMNRIVLVLCTFVFLPIFEASFSDDFWRPLHGKLIPSDSRALNHTCGKHFLPDEVEFRSIGSTLAKNKEYPWTVGLKVPTKRCSAVLISTRHVLTAAHCVTIPIKDSKNSKNSCRFVEFFESQVQIYPGTKVKDMLNIPLFTGSFRVVNMTVHPNYKPCLRGNDIALLELSQNMFSDGSPICMPDANETIPEVLTLTGFGWNPNDPKRAMLQAVNLTFNSTTIYNEIETYTQDKAPCQGDSGGPLFKTKNGKHILLGIAYASTQCQKDGTKKRALFDDVRTQIEWICRVSGFFFFSMISVALHYPADIQYF